MGLLETILARLEAVEAKNALLTAKIEQIQRGTGSGRKEELAAYLGRSVSWVEKRCTKFPRYRAGGAYRYEFKKVEEYLKQESLNIYKRL